MLYNICNKCKGEFNMPYLNYLTALNGEKVYFPMLANSFINELHSMEVEDTKVAHLSCIAICFIE